MLSLNRVLNNIHGLGHSNYYHSSLLRNELEPLEHKKIMDKKLTNDEYLYGVLV